MEQTAEEIREAAEWMRDWLAQSAKPMRSPHPWNDRFRAILAAAESAAAERERADANEREWARAARKVEELSEALSVACRGQGDLVEMAMDEAREAIGHDATAPDAGDENDLADAH